MTFRPKLIAKIVAGHKTETRRPRTDDRCQYRVGKDYAVQPGRGKHEVARIEITDVRQEALGDIDDKGARREGFKNRAEFMDYWLELYGELDEALPVWAITFKAVGPKALYLTHPIPKRQGDYTTNAEKAIDDLETVDRPTLESYAKDARAKPHAATRKLWEHEREQLAGSIERLEQDVGANDLLASELRVLRRRLAAIDRKLQRAA